MRARRSPSPDWLEDMLPIGEDVGGAEVGMEIAAEGVGVLGAEVGLDAAQGKVHDGEAAGRAHVGAPVAFGCLRFAPAVRGKPELSFEAEIGGGVVRL